LATTLSLNPIVNVIINLSPLSAIRNGFDLGLIIGSATVIPKSERIRIYTDTNSMLEDGFKDNDPEYKAAQLYFSSPGQPTRLAVGRQDLTAVPAETALDAVTACRLANSDWYAVMVCNKVKADILAIAGYIETATPHSAFFYTTADADVLSNTAGNVFGTMKGLLYKRSIGMYSTTVNAIASIMGYAMGANNGTRNSAYTLAYKTMPGVVTENLTNTQVTNIKANNGNLYLSRGGQYNVFEQGHVANGTSFDELINLDKLANDIQLSVMDALYQAPKIPQIEAGVTQLINAISEPCRQAVNVGFIAPGLWKGQSILNLKNGDVLQEGFLIQAESINSQTQADRDARKAPYIYVAIKLAGAIEFVVIRVDVNR
jgi:hypothetical protein